MYLYVSRRGRHIGHDVCTRLIAVMAGDLTPRNAARENVTLRTSAKISFQCAYHVVWCPKYRASVIEGEIEERLRQIVVDVVRANGAWLRHIHTKPNFVYLVVEVEPQFGVHRLVKAIKKRSAGVLRQEYPLLRSRLPSMWTNSYLVATAGEGTPPALIEQYVRQQNPR